jgi:peptidoglycan/LPS O-acetylase OafA/YrhL
MAGAGGSERVFGLDLVRALAIVLVVLGHGKPMLAGTLLAGFPFFRMIDGVDMFFVLSGFLIGNILLKQLAANGGFSGRDLGPFWIRRWFRTLPNYYLVLLLDYLLIKFGLGGGDLGQFNWKFLFFLQNFSTPFHGFFWESWSLAVEEWFYLIFPILLVLLNHFFKARTAYFVGVCLMLLFPILYRAFNYDPAITPDYFDLGIRKVVLTRLDSIGYGLLAAYFFRFANGFWLKYRWHSFFIGVAVMVFVLNIDCGITSIYAQVFHYLLSPLSVMFVLPLMSSIKRCKWKVGAVVTHISKISYAMYLLNLGVVLNLMRHNTALFGPATGLGMFLAYWAVVVLLSTLLYYVYEKPMTDLRDRLR